MRKRLIGRLPRPFAEGTVAMVCRLALWLVSGGCCLLAVILTPLHWIDVSAPRLVELAAFTPIGTPFAFVALVAGLVLVLVHRATRWEAAAVAAASAATLALHVWWIAPLYIGSRPVVAGKPLVILSQNFEYGDPRQLARVVRAEHVDVLVLTDLGGQRANEVSATYIDRLLPYSIGVRSDQWLSSVVFARFPIGQVRSGPDSPRADLIHLRTPSIGDINLVTVHPQPPYSSTWRTDYNVLTSYLRGTASRSSSPPTIVAGDFNATMDNVPFRRILDLGFADAMAQAHGGLHPTWPDSSVRRYFGVPVPRLVTIDHVLTSLPLTVARASTVHIPGSDHSGIIAQVARRAS